MNISDRKGCYHVITLTAGQYKKLYRIKHPLTAAGAIFYFKICKMYYKIVFTAHSPTHRIQCKLLTTGYPLKD